MIIECEKCRSKFNLDEVLLKKEGSKVRCSVCKQVFLAYPPALAPFMEKPLAPQVLDEDLEETVALDSPPLVEKEEPDLGEGDLDADFEKAFGEALEEKEAVQAVSPDDLPEIEEELFDMEKAIDQATTIEKEVTTADAESKASESQEEIEEIAPPSPAKEKAGMSRLLIVIFVVFLILVGGAIALYRWAPELVPGSLSVLKPTTKQALTDPGISGLSFKAVAGSFTTTDAGQLFIIKGSVTNNYPMPRSFILIKGSILDDKGQVIKQQLVFAGNTFSEKDIKEMTTEEIYKGLKVREGREKINTNIQPQASIPFMIIFDNLPEKMSEFTVEAVSSSPVK